MCPACFIGEPLAAQRSIVSRSFISGAQDGGWARFPLHLAPSPKASIISVAAAHQCNSTGAEGYQEEPAKRTMKGEAEVGSEKRASGSAFSRKHLAES